MQNDNENGLNSSEFLNFSVVKDDSLNYSDIPADLNDGLEYPLLSINTHVKELIDDFIYECKQVDAFYKRQGVKIMNNFKAFYRKFTTKLDNPRAKFNLEDDLKEHNLDELGYSSSWARKFAKFYSKLSWLQGFAKINVVAMQKIADKIHAVLFDSDNDEIQMKLQLLVKNMEIHHGEECENKRRKIVNLVAKHYFFNDTEEAFKFLDSGSYQHKIEKVLPLMFL